ncbi:MULTISPECIES: amino acid ABC transporter ATP-binding protein [unclassified Rhizobium]|uniref:amino acid ABC transporter ATP-binding protein n=1 Tax=unclassified Rhizobium TaxID=2613769 RepID=UPI0006F7AD23|nr:MULTISPECIES: amino acid ABC transporter ATP-binding protein [unclassified Rhizobium]KQV39375.1 ectoine/hydroxyectoine ABC transporter ATP-binding protein EhuA [Rhizobium sp. Root1212]KRD35380.1 ectoine/hydroxyectoine ABC transporter ATP-binding protein EhuA [Rhizobium sp. Root268]
MDLVRIEDVHKSYGHLEVLKGVSFSVAKGDVQCIVGPSGSGKSTLLRCINHLETINRGRIWVEDDLIGYRQNGRILHEMSDSELCHQRSQIGMVFQSFNLFAHRTSLENVIEGPIQVRSTPKTQAIEKARALLAQVGMDRFENYYPRQLSGGQQQRVAIARALAMEPKVVLFDEPTSALDPERVGEVLDVMCELAKTGMTMIVVTHEIGFAREVGSTLIFMDQGVVVEKGKPRDVIERSNNERAQAFFSKIL